MWPPPPLPPRYVPPPTGEPKSAYGFTLDLRAQAGRSHAQAIVLHASTIMRLRFLKSPDTAVAGCRQVRDAWDGRTSAAASHPAYPCLPVAGIPTLQAASTHPTRPFLRKLAGSDPEWYSRCCYQLPVEQPNLRAGILANLPDADLGLLNSMNAEQRQFTEDLLAQRALMAGYMNKVYAAWTLALYNADYQRMCSDLLRAQVRAANVVPRELDFDRHPIYTRPNLPLSPLAYMTAFGGTYSGWPDYNLGPLTQVLADQDWTPECLLQRIHASDGHLRRVLNAHGISDAQVARAGQPPVQRASPLVRRKPQTAHPRAVQESAAAAGSGSAAARSAAAAQPRAPVRALKPVEESWAQHRQECDEALNKQRAKKGLPPIPKLPPPRRQPTPAPAAAEEESDEGSDEPEPEPQQQPQQDQEQLQRPHRHRQRGGRKRQRHD